MKAIIIGATGTLGTAVASALEDDFDLVRASRHGDVRVDLDDPASIAALFDTVTSVDAVVCCAASGPLTPLAGSTYDGFLDGIRGKLLGQVHLVRCAVERLNDGGSITLTSGTFPSYPPGSNLGALVNAGLDGFVTAAAGELTRGLRINAVSPGWIRETLVKLDVDPAIGTPAAVVARAYVEAVTGSAQGQVLRP